MATMSQIPASQSVTPAVAMARVIEALDERDAKLASSRIEALRINLEKGSTSYVDLDQHDVIGLLNKAWRLDNKGTDLRTTIVAFLIQFIRAEKNCHRESVVGAYSSFFPRLLSAIEAGFDVSAAGSLSAYSNYSEAIDAMFMGATGKANLQSLFADDDLLQRTLRVLASIPAFPSHAIQFNLVLAANRVYRHAKKHAPAAASQMAKSKAITPDTLTGLSKANDFREYGRVALHGVQGRYHRGELGLPAPAAAETEPIPSYPHLPPSAGGVYSFPITEFFCPQSNRGLDGMPFRAWGEYLDISLCGLAALLLHPGQTQDLAAGEPGSGYTFTKPAGPLTSINGAGTLTIDEAPWSQISSIEVYLYRPDEQYQWSKDTLADVAAAAAAEKALLTTPAPSPFGPRMVVRASVTAGSPQKKLFSFGFASVESLGSALEAIRRLRLEQVALKVFRPNDVGAAAGGGKKGKSKKAASNEDNGHIVDAITAGPDAEAAYAQGLLKAGHAVWVEQQLLADTAEAPGMSARDVAVISMQAEAAVLSSQNADVTASQAEEQVIRTGKQPPRCSKTGDLKISGKAKNYDSSAAPSMEEMFEGQGSVAAQMRSSLGGAARDGSASAVGSVAASVPAPVAPSEPSAPAAGGKGRGKKSRDAAPAAAPAPAPLVDDDEYGRVVSEALMAQQQKQQQEQMQVEVCPSLTGPDEAEPEPEPAQVVKGKAGKRGSKASAPVEEAPVPAPVASAVDTRERRARKEVNYKEPEESQPAASLDDNDDDGELSDGFTRRRNGGKAKPASAAATSSSKAGTKVGTKAEAKGTKASSAVGGENDDFGFDDDDDQKMGSNSGRKQTSSGVSNQKAAGAKAAFEAAASSTPAASGAGRGAPRLSTILGGGVIAGSGTASQAGSRTGSGKLVSGAGAASAAKSKPAATVTKASADASLEFDDDDADQAAAAALSQVIGAAASKPIVAAKANTNGSKAGALASGIAGLSLGNINRIGNTGSGGALAAVTKAAAAAASAAAADEQKKRGVIVNAVATVRFDSEATKAPKASSNDSKKPSSSRGDDFAFDGDGDADMDGDDVSSMHAIKSSKGSVGLGLPAVTPGPRESKAGSTSGAAAGVGGPAGGSFGNTTAANRKSRGGLVPEVLLQQSSLQKPTATRIPGLPPAPPAPSPANYAAMSSSKRFNGSNAGAAGSGAASTGHNKENTGPAPSSSTSSKPKPATVSILNNFHKIGKDSKSSSSGNGSSHGAGASGDNAKVANNGSGTKTITPVPAPKELSSQSGAPDSDGDQEMGDGGYGAQYDNDADVLNFDHHDAKTPAPKSKSSSGGGGGDKFGFSFLDSEGSEGGSQPWAGTGAGARSKAAPSTGFEFSMGLSQFQNSDGNDYGDGDGSVATGRKAARGAGAGGRSIDDNSEEMEDGSGFTFNFGQAASSSSASGDDVGFGAGIAFDADGDEGDLLHSIMATINGQVAKALASAQTDMQAKRRMRREELDDKLSSLIGGGDDGGAAARNIDRALSTAKGKVYAAAAAVEAHCEATKKRATQSMDQVRLAEENLMVQGREIEQLGGRIFKELKEAETKGQEEMAASLTSTAKAGLANVQKAVQDAKKKQSSIGHALKGLAEQLQSLF